MRNKDIRIASAFSLPFFASDPEAFLPALRLSRLKAGFFMPATRELAGCGGPRRQRVLDQGVKHLPAGPSFGLHGHPLR